MSEIDPWDAALNEVAVGMARQAQAVIDEKDQLIASLRDQLKSAQSELERARKDAERVTSEAGEYFAKLVLANDLLRDSRVKFASICTGAECDHDGFTYEEIASLAQQGAYAIDFHFARRDSALKEQTP